jgi:hypothetical protein
MADCGLVEAIGPAAGASVGAGEESRDPKSADVSSASGPGPASAKGSAAPNGSTKGVEPASAKGSAEVKESIKGKTPGSAAARGSPIANGSLADVELGALASPLTSGPNVSRAGSAGALSGMRGSAIVVGSAAGICTTEPHLGHLTFLPASFSLAVS